MQAQIDEQMAQAQTNMKKAMDNETAAGPGGSYQGPWAPSA